MSTTMQHRAGNPGSNVCGRAYPSGRGTIGDGTVFGYLAVRHVGSRTTRDI
jgi:hypothetical protein